ncbi:hypothetical protein KAX75_01400 [candidate division WOR-3 bacterium]|nr:hypothetical protein [candidate division WOR-3 bacterium]
MCENSPEPKVKIRRLSFVKETPDLLLGAEKDDELVWVIIASTKGGKGWLNRIAVVDKNINSVSFLVEFEGAKEE